MGLFWDIENPVNQSSFNGGKRKETCENTQIAIILGV